MDSNVNPERGQSSPRKDSSQSEEVKNQRCMDENHVVPDDAHIERSRRGWRRVVLNFTPAWFAVSMGTGVVSILLFNLPYNAAWLYWISVVIFAVNVVMFVAFLFLSVLRYTMFPGLWARLIRHPTQSSFLGCFPIALGTIVNMVAYVCVPAWGHRLATLAWALWWIQVASAVAANFYLPFFIMHLHSKATLSTVNGTWLLPMIATTVVAASGAVVASVLPDEQALITIVTGYVLWGCGVPLAMVTLVIYFYRLTVQGLPSRDIIVSVFIPLGPLGQGAFGIMQLGKEALRLAPRLHFIPKASIAGEVLYVVGILMALIMWGFALVWLFFAVASITRSRFPFNLGWWSLTFPLGVFTFTATTLAKELTSVFFKIVGTIFSLVVVLLWILVSAVTIYKAVMGQLTPAPDAQDWESEQMRKQQDAATDVEDRV